MKQWKLKAAQRRCTQCIDNEAADAYAAADPAVIRAKNEYLRALEELVAVEAARPELREFARVTSEMIVQMTRAALEWEERNPFEYDDGSPDPLLRALREPGETGYKVPTGGLFEYVSGANYLCEMIEWAGFALACRTPAAQIFAACVIFNLAPRALSHHAWYREKFGDAYPSQRRALVPFLV